MPYRESFAIEAEDDQFIYAIDVDGHGVRLPKRGMTMIINREAFEVQALIPYGVRHQLTLPDHASARRAQKPRKKRRCLNCGHAFNAEYAMRVCYPCKKTAMWKHGSDYQII